MGEWKHDEKNGKGQITESSGKKHVYEFKNDL